MVELARTWKDKAPFIPRHTDTLQCFWTDSPFRSGHAVLRPSIVVVVQLQPHALAEVDAGLGGV